MADQDSNTPQEPKPKRRAWVSPRLEELPKLTELTLQTGGGVPGGGGTGGGGSVVF